MKTKIIILIAMVLSLNGFGQSLDSIKIGKFDTFKHKINMFDVFKHKNHYKQPKEFAAVLSSMFSTADLDMNLPYYQLNNGFKNEDFDSYQDNMSDGIFWQIEGDLGWKTKRRYRYSGIYFLWEAQRAEDGGHYQTNNRLEENIKEDRFILAYKFSYDITKLDEWFYSQVVSFGGSIAPGLLINRGRVGIKSLENWSSYDNPLWDYQKNSFSYGPIIRGELWVTPFGVIDIKLHGSLTYQLSSFQKNGVNTETKGFYHSYGGECKFQFLPIIQTGFVANVSTSPNGNFINGSYFGVFGRITVSWKGTRPANDYLIFNEMYGIKRVSGMSRDFFCG